MSGTTLEQDVDAGQGQLDPIAELEKLRADIQRRSEEEAAERQAASAREAQLAAERDAAAAAATQFQGRVAALETDSMASRETALKAAESAAALAYRAAREAGDIDAELAATRDLSRTQANLQILETERRYQRPQPSVEQPRPVQQPRERAEPRVSSESQRWIDAHPRMKTDPAYHAEVATAHDRAIRRGIQVDTPAYFEALDDYMERMMPSTDGGRDTSAPRAQQPKPRQAGQAETSYGLTPDRGGSAGARSGEKLMSLREIGAAFNLRPEEVIDMIKVSGTAEEEYRRQMTAELRDGSSVKLTGQGAIYR
jgi:hypothetical protein